MVKDFKEVVVWKLKEQKHILLDFVQEIYCFGSSTVVEEPNMSTSRYSQYIGLSELKRREFNDNKW